MEKRDYYEVLGVDRNADERTLKKAYRKMAMEFHPDRNPDDAEAEAKFKEAAEAYAVLNDAEKRSVYDRFGHAGLQGGGPGFGDVGDIFSHFQDFFGDMFGGFGGGGGGRGRRTGPSRGSHVRTTVRLSLAECMTGTERELELRHPTPCGACDGTGAKDGKLERCTTCGGVGRVAQRRGGFLLQTACPTCHGAGVIAVESCPECEGTGQLTQERTVRVTIPAGIDEGQQLRLSGKGQAGSRGGPPGDLYVDVAVDIPSGFGRDGYDLVRELKVSYPQAALGAKIELEALVEGEPPVELKVPPGTQPGDTVVVRDAGFPRLDGRGEGDLVCLVQVDVPKDLSPRAKELIEELQSAFEN
ncbi:MAG: molecular chaperone DnaJ [Myxococcota bacterium]